MYRLKAASCTSSLHGAFSLNHREPCVGTSWLEVVGVIIGRGNDRASAVWLGRLFGFRF